MTEETTNLREHQRFATYRKGVNNKFYQVRVEEREDGGANVYFVYGRIGTAGKTDDKGFYGSYAYAVSIADQQFEKKLKKGYQEQKSSLVLLAMTVEEPEERKGDGLPAVDVRFVMPFGISKKLKERLDKFARKYLSKLNLIRKDYYALGDKYAGQIEALGLQFCAENKRICESKGFGAEASEHDVQQAIIYYYRALREETAVGNYYWPMRNFHWKTGLYD